MQRLTLIGNLGGDAILRTVNDKTAINFSVAHTAKFKKKDGVTSEKTTWWDCTIWRNNDQRTEIAKYLLKGTKVMVEGEPEAEQYSDKDGKPALSMKCFVKNIELLSSIKKEDNQGSQTAKTAPAEQGKSVNNLDDDLPF